MTEQAAGGDRGNHAGTRRGSATRRERIRVAVISDILAAEIAGAGAGNFCELLERGQVSRRLGLEARWMHGARRMH